MATLVQKPRPYWVQVDGQIVGRFRCFYDVEGALAKLLPDSGDSVVEAYEEAELIYRYRPGRGTYIRM